MFGQEAGLRWPRLRVLAEGRLLAGVTDVDVVSNNYFSADRFSVTAALGADPAGLRALAGRAEILIDVQASLGDGTGFESLVKGEVDGLDLDPLQGVLRLEGRDLSARLIEARTHETFANRTASEIAIELAGRHGLTADVQPTTTPVGRYWQLQHDRIMFDQFGRATTEWDLLVTLAQLEGFDVWASGDVLHFRPQATRAPAYRLRPADVTGLRLERALTLARDIEVTVKSWNSRQQNAFVQTARKRAVPQGRGQAQRYVVMIPNLTPAEALRIAQERLAELSRHERVVVAEMPGELDIRPRGLVSLTGTGTDFDQQYRVDRVERRISVAHGFSQTVRMRNASEAGQVAASAARQEVRWTDF